MKICVECKRDHAGDLERCALCGGELRKRSISEAMIELTEESTAAKLPCPRCDTKVELSEPRGPCSSCRALLAKAADADGRPVLTRP